MTAATNAPEISAAAAEVRGILRAAWGPGRGGLTLAEIGRRSTLRRPLIAAALDELHAAAMVARSHGRGGVGSELWRSLTELERLAKLAQRARQAALDLHLGADCDVHEGSLATLLRLPDDERERIAALCDAYDAAFDAAWTDDGGSLRPDAPEVGQADDQDDDSETA